MHEILTRFKKDLQAPGLKNVLIFNGGQEKRLSLCSHKSSANQNEDAVSAEVSLIITVNTGEVVAVHQPRPAPTHVCCSSAGATRQRVQVCFFHQAIWTLLKFLSTSQPTHRGEISAAPVGNPWFNNLII